MNSTIKTFTLFAIIVSTLAFTGCESDNILAPVADSPIVLDTAPPTVPTGLAAAPAKNENVKVSWDANVLDEDFHGFMVYRVIWGDHFPMLTLPTQENIWIDDHPVNIACTYVVTALDESGNESAWAAVNYYGQEDRPNISMD